MNRKTHNLTQGTPEWLAFRAQHFGASDAPAMLGLSKYVTRSQLLAQKATGISPDVDEHTQRIFDHGHATEALARPIIEAQIGEDLYPVTMSMGKLSASCDGLTLSNDLAFEHKQANAALMDSLRAGVLPEEYQPQCQQIMLVTGAKRVLFVCSDGTEENMVSLFVEPDPAMQAKIVAGWELFESDLAAYVPPAATEPAPAGKAPESLPALRIEVTGMVTASNLAEFKQTALAAIGSVNRELSTDQDFADAEKAVKWCGDVEERLAAAKQHALSQTASIDELFRAIDDISAEARRVRLDLEKLVKARKEAIRGEIVAAGQAALKEHVDGLNFRLGKPYMPAVAADFAAAVKGKRTVESLRNAVDTALADAKLRANAVADQIQVNLNTLRELAKDHAFLFADTAQIVLKDPEAVTAIVKGRISEHEAKEAERAEAERQRIRAEEEAKARREAEAAAPAAAQPVAETPKLVQPAPAMPIVDLGPADPPTRIKSQDRKDLDMLLDMLPEADILRTLHFVKSRFGMKAA